MATSGSIESIALNGRSFAVAADADSNRKLGGMENEIQSNGNGTFRTVQTRVTSMIDGLAIEIDDANGDHEFIQDLANSGFPFAVAVTYADGRVYQGAMQFSGELQKSSQSGTMPISLAGGELTPQ